MVIAVWVKLAVDVLNASCNGKAVGSSESPGGVMPVMLKELTSRGDKPVETLSEREFQPLRSLEKLSATRGLIENER